jgi:hypothetical protein
MADADAIRQFFNACALHDWHYNYSDDPGVYRRGADADTALRSQADGDPDLKAVWDRWAEYTSGGQWRPMVDDFLPKAPEPPDPAQFLLDIVAPVPVAGGVDLAPSQDQTAVWPRLSAEASAMLKLFSVDTYCVNIGPAPEREELILLGLLQWVPAPVWSGHHTYALTEAGRQIAGLRPKGPTDGR